MKYTRMPEPFGGDSKVIASSSLASSSRRDAKVNLASMLSSNLSKAELNVQLKTTNTGW